MCDLLVFSAYGVSLVYEAVGESARAGCFPHRGGRNAKGPSHKLLLDE